MSKKIELTNHAVDRGRERFRLKRDALLRTAKKAWRRGVSIAANQGILYSCREEIPNESIVKVYGHMSFVFQKHGNARILLTIVQTDNRIMSSLKRLGS